MDVAEEQVQDLVVRIKELQRLLDSQQASQVCSAKGRALAGKV